MTKPVDPFSRLYWRLIDDEKFVDVYEDDHHFALWTRLLMAADMAWPASAALPYGTRKASLAKLVDVGLVDQLPGSRYRIHGMNSERGKRQPRQGDPTGPAAEPDGDPTGPEREPDGALARASSQPAKPVEPVTASQPAEWDAFEDYQKLTGSWPSPKVTPWLSQLVDEFGEKHVCQVMEAIWRKSPDPKTFMSRTQDACREISHRIVKEREQKRAEAEKRRAAREREEIESMPEEQRAANMARLKVEMQKAGLVA